MRNAVGRSSPARGAGRHVYRLQGLSDLVLGGAGLFAAGWTAALMSAGPGDWLEPGLRLVGLVLFLFALGTLALSAAPESRAARRLFPIYPALNWGYVAFCAAVLAWWHERWSMAGWVVVTVTALGAVGFALAQHRLNRRR
ncbi:MAG TPA: hypothetical protein VED40_07470 [Azospirillaceae bacterium]|nr:hypothetical protein [Azospirillaceae bacterium]